MPAGACPERSRRAGMTSFPRKRESRTMRRRNYAHASYNPPRLAKAGIRGVEKGERHPGADWQKLQKGGVLILHREERRERKEGGCLQDSERTVFDVVVVGAGNAAFTAALAARAEGARVLVLEKAPKELRGGNTRFTGGVFRCTYNGIEDLIPIVRGNDNPDTVRVQPYTRADYFKNLEPVTGGRGGPPPPRGGGGCSSHTTHLLSAARPPPR